MIPDEVLEAHRKELNDIMCDIAQHCCFEEFVRMHFSVGDITIRIAGIKK